VLLQQKNRLSLKEEQHYSISAGKGINFVLQVTTFNKIMYTNLEHLILLSNDQAIF